MRSECIKGGDSLEFYNFSNPNIGEGECTSKGMLIKWIYAKKHIKSGRIQLRRHLGQIGIEPVLEVLIYRIARALNIPVAEEHFGVVAFKKQGADYLSLANVSEDFLQGNELIELSEITIIEDKFLKFEDLVMKYDELYKLLYLDYVICNEDRHNKNVAWLIDKNNQLKLSPIYDNGYSLLYDDIQGLLNNYVNASKQCLCNAPIYSDSMSHMRILLKKYKYMHDASGIINIRNTTVHKIIYSTMVEYNTIVEKYPIQNIPLPKCWWEAIESFITWRLSDVRSI